MMKSKIWIIVLMFSLLSLVGCTTTATQEPNETTNTEESNDEQQGIAIGEPNPQGAPASDDAVGVNDPSAKISADAAILKAIENIVSIELTDIDGSKVDRVFSEDEISMIETAYNESVIQDTAYIEMLAGKTMLISLKDGTTIFISSYGNEDFIVATSSTGNSYHLACPVIGKILLGTE